jgi:competence protein ComEC
VGKRPPIAQVDPIRLQIEALDEELRPPRPFTDRIMESCPLLPPACGLIVGLILQRKLSFPFWFWAVILLILIFAALYVRKRPSFRHRLIALLWIGFFAGILLGAVRLRLFQSPRPDDIRRRIPDQPALASLGGRILTEPRLEDRSQWVFGQTQWTARSTSFILRIDEALTTDGWEPASGIVYASISEPVRSMKAGDRIRFHGRLNRPRPPDNPGMFDGKQYLENQGIFRVAQIPALQSIILHEQDRRGYWHRLIGRFREGIYETMDAFGGDQKEYSDLPQALLLGKRSTLPVETWLAFQKTGLAHYISLSGMHVGILSGIFWWFGRAAGLEKRTRAMLCILLIGLYAAAVPPRAPTLRAVFLAEFVFLSILICQRPQPLNTLALTALVLLLIQPCELFQAGWQLSYATVLGILLFYESLFTILSKPLFLYPQISDWLFRFPGGSILWTILQSSLKLLSVGFSAWLGGAGILLWHFGTLTPLSAVWTVLVFPLVFLILLTGFMKWLLVPLLPTLAALCSVWLDILSDWFVRIVTALADLDLFAFRIGRVGLWAILLYYVWLLGICFLPSGKRFRQSLAVVSAIGILLALSVDRIQRSFSKDLTITCLSVGHGLAVIGEIPGSKTFLFDGGSISLKDPGGRVIVPFLNHHGINSLDAVIISHGDLDHYNGLPEVLEAVQSQSIFVNPGFLERAKTSAAAGQMQSILRSHRILATTSELPYDFGAAHIRHLWPDEKTAADQSISNNDKSEVILLEFAGKTVLLCGDIEEYAQTEILKQYPDLKADILLLPHHGSGRNILPEFIRRLHPDIRIVSCTRNRIKNVTPLDNQGANWYTPLHGAVTITIKADGTIQAAGFLNFP